jgi:cobalt-zinc-cadmium efflux system protein
MAHQHSHEHGDRDHHPHNPDHSSHHHSHGHGHGHSHAPVDYSRAFAIGLALNLGFVGVEVFYGLVADSVALLADAGHNLSDVLGLVLAWGAAVLSKRRPTSRYTYGWRRSSILAAFLNALILMVVTGGIAWEAIQRFWHPVPVQGGIIIVVALIGIVINGITAMLFMSGRKSDINIRAAFLHMVGDALVSLGVVLAGIGILLTGWQWLDPAFSLIISAVIVFNTWEVLTESFNLSIDAVPQGIEQQAVYSYLAERPGVTQVHDLHIWGMSTTETALTAHLVIPGGFPGDDFLCQIRQELQGNFGIHHTTLQIELNELDCNCPLEKTVNKTDKQ